MKTLSSHAEAAKLIRAELKAAFPATKFTVSSKTYSGGNSVDVTWNNGPLVEAVKNIVDKYEQGDFNAMTDCYEYTNSRDHAQVKYVFTQRNVSEEITMQSFNDAKKYFGFLENAVSLNDWLKDHSSTVGQFLYRIVRKMDLTNGYTFEAFKQAARN